MAPSYHSELAGRAKKVLNETGRDWRTGKPFLLAPDSEIIALLWELTLLVSADAEKATG